MTSSYRYHSDAELPISQWRRVTDIAVTPSYRYHSDIELPILQWHWVTDITVTHTFPKLVESVTKLHKYLWELSVFWMCPEVMFVCCCVWNEVFLVSVKRNNIFTKWNFVWILSFFVFVHFHLMSSLRRSGVIPLTPLSVFMACTVTYLVRVTTNTRIRYKIRAKFVHCCWAYQTNCNSSPSCFCLSGPLWRNPTKYTLSIKRLHIWHVRVIYN